MSKKSKIRLIKRIIKVFIAVVILVLLILLGFFVKHTRTFEDANMKKWLELSASQQTQTVKRIIPQFDGDTLLVQCITKIAELPDSEKMNIRDAAVLCYNGIKINETETNEK